MTREFNKNPRYDSRPPYRGSSSNNNYGAEQPSRPTRPRLNRATVDRAWENGAPHRHADYKPRHPNEAGTTQAHYGSNSQRNWRKVQSSEHSSHDHAFHERGDGKYPSQYHNAHKPYRSDHSSNGYQEPHSRSAKPHNSFADQPPYRDQRGHGNEDSAYRTRNGHPNSSHTPQETQRRRYYQEGEQQENHRNGAYSYRTNPANHTSNGAADRRDQRTRPYDQRGTPDHDNRFTRPQRTNSNAPRYPSYPITPGKQPGNRSYQQHEQFEGDYEQFDHAPPHQSRNDRRPEEQLPQVPAQKMGQTPEVERHVTPLPDGRVLKGPRSVQRKNAQFWTDISQDTKELVDQVHTPEETAHNSTSEQAQTNALPVERSTPPAHAASTRAQAAKRTARAARQGKMDKPVSSGPKPSQRGFKWPSPSPQQ